MNDTINQMLKRGSVRKFSSKPIENEVLETILKATIQAPSYINGQQYSIIIVEDEKKRELLYNMTTGSSGSGMTFIKKAPVFLLFIMDFNRIDKAVKKENLEMHIHESIEALLVGSVDIGILLEAATVSAESLGLGSVVVGAIRKDTKSIIEAFNLPKYTYPICGLALGYPHSDTSIKTTPRLPLEATVYRDSYDNYALDKHIDAYDKQMEEVYNSRGAKTSWTKLIATYFQYPIRKEQIDDYKNQGFDI